MFRRTPVDVLRPQPPLWLALSAYVVLVSALVGGTVIGALAMVEPAVPFVQQFTKHR